MFSSNNNSFFSLTPTQANVYAPLIPVYTPPPPSPFTVSFDLRNAAHDLQLKRDLEERERKAKERAAKEYADFLRAERKKVIDAAKRAANETFRKYREALAQKEQKYRDQGYYDPMYMHAGPWRFKEGTIEPEYLDYRTMKPISYEEAILLEQDRLKNRLSRTGVDKDKYTLDDFAEDHAFHEKNAKFHSKSLIVAKEHSDNISDLGLQGHAYRQRPVFNPYLTKGSEHQASNSGHLRRSSYAERRYESIRNRLFDKLSVVGLDLRPENTKDVAPNNKSVFNNHFVKIKKRNLSTLPSAGKVQSIKPLKPLAPAWENKEGRYVT